MSVTPAVPPGRLAWAVFFAAAGVLGFEIALMRILLVASWHHFAFVVISIALLGFGASGTMLFLGRSWVVPRGEAVLFVLILISAISMPICTGAAQLIPIEARLIPALMGKQIGFWVLYWLILGIPFFVGAGAIGLALMIARTAIPRIYAANLLGSGAGAATVTVAMNVLPPPWLPTAMAVIVVIGTPTLRPRSKLLRIGAWLGSAGILAGAVLIGPPDIRLDPYKYGAYVNRLQQQGLVSRIGEAYGPRAVVEAYEGNVLHDLPFLSGSVAPPAISVLLQDGHLIGSVLNIQSPDDAAVMDHTVMAFPYEVSAAHPRVLLLGETGGINVWLAKRREAHDVYVVQPDAQVIALMRGPLSTEGGHVLDLPGVMTVVAEPRHFVEQTNRRFDLIQLVMLESSAAGSGGIGGLAENYLLTTQGIKACLRSLTDEGIVAVTRGIQDPPRDNLKLFALFAAALRELNVNDPGGHFVIVRDFLAVCTIVKASPWSAEQIVRVRQSCAERGLTPVWFPGIRTDELNQPDQLPGPTGESGDWYHYAAGKLFSHHDEEFINDWVFDIRPTTDDRPFFLDFCKWSSIGELQRAYGDLWLTRTELAFLFVLAVLVVVGLAGLVFTVLPLFVYREARRTSGRGVVAIYFTAIGLGFMLLEMTFLSRLTLWIGDAVTAAAVTISGFLLASGGGSLTAQRLGQEAPRWVPRIVGLLIIVGLVELLVLGKLAVAVGAMPPWARCLAALLAIAPLAFLMGFPMPTALQRLDRGRPLLIPWAWGVNGFASLTAAPLAMVIGMSWSYSMVGGLALALYAFPAVLFSRLPAQTTNS